MAAHAGRIPRRRIDRGSAAAGRVLAGAVHHLPDPDLADRRIGRRAVRRRAGRGDGRLVVRIRLFCRRPLLDRQCAPGRCQDLRLAVAVCDHRIAGLARSLHGIRRCAGAFALDPGSDAHPVARAFAYAFGLVARASVQRLSLERLRLHAGDAFTAGAERFANRPLGPDLPRRCRLRITRGARRRWSGYPAALAGAGLERARSRRDGRRLMSTACGCASCSPTCSRTRSSTIPRSRR
jgi:hypothetical protein